jgi:hypothetical protein
MAARPLPAIADESREQRIEAIMKELRPKVEAKRPNPTTSAAVWWGLACDLQTPWTRSAERSPLHALPNYLVGGLERIERLGYSCSDAHL